MKSESLDPKRSTCLRRNESNRLIISIKEQYFDKIYIINGNRFITEKIQFSDLSVKPKQFYMLINDSDEIIKVSYDVDITTHEIVYDPYKFETSEKKNLKEEDLKQKFEIHDGYIDVLPKWYSFKFTYADYNLIFIKPEYGISIQVHKFRSENWDVIEGNPIIINGNTVHYYVPNGTQFTNRFREFHSVINPNANKFVIIKEYWKGEFDEEDIIRVFNPNNYK